MNNELTELNVIGLPLSPRRQPTERIMTEDNEYCEKHCKGYRDTGGRCFADGRCDAYWDQKQKKNYEEDERISQQNA